MVTAIDKIILTEVEKRFAGLVSPALATLTTEITGGSVTGLVGPDGAGKTTLLRMLAGLLKPDRGNITILGLDPIRQGVEVRRHLGYMPQKFGLYEDLTVQENLDLYASLCGVMGERRQKIYQQLLDFTDLTRFTQRLAGKLSGGMKQKLGLACTLISRPKVLLLDEPGVGVDPIARQELWRMVHELASEGMLILWSTSYLDEAEQCRDILLLNQGQLLYQGVPQTLTNNIAGRSFLLRVPASQRRAYLQEALLLPQTTDCVIQGHYIRVILKENSQQTDFLTSLNLANSKLITAKPRFEDAFIDLLGGSPSQRSELAEIMPQIPADPSETVIEAQNLSKRFGDFAATDNVNFAVKRGEIFGLLGPNGAGKSTTFKMMCGLMVPTAGRALVLGMDLKISSNKARQHLGYMAQKFSLYGNLTVAQNLTFFSGIYGLSGSQQQQKISSMINAFNLAPILKQTTDELPLGFKQRLALACALMHEPDILFLDEPTSGVDPLTRREFWLHINGMVNKGVTVMVTTHFMDEAEYCDRIGLVYHGKIIAVGTPDELKSQIVTAENQDPSMEQAFISLILNYDRGKQ
ncbi:ATP-binding cassette domain-containing protein [Arsenophonus nasoniae]|uniref:ATP-binding cassette domain-containing protein n=1 Tax=Arsenophonus nasoniae TaxID=638 RepID=A0A4P7KTC0_9GAMM|nr:ATP-binding cassette domain-containing protein [Arsenophonus nasoniae]QBY43006.1 putative ABC transporter ATP-binding protein YbhF [Arsenophonus nasoniae]WGM02774.1 ATP-binding cassette domain-containing protein [Arsenophonus nasoniae]WGM07047.1 ATP-binding cassette domain-containing protein [Arsenophonus nasoniae]WGM11927.1 ATP-binding cassette domain-containing protein [Arsenophonus nasoniae]WGM16612.1 ATP-binding cassette domain-containing protein [Arsenophonus nasoniae]